MPTLSISALLALASAPLLASSFAGTTAQGASAGSSASSASSASTSGNDKRIVQAREDAAGFVASAGQLRTARLEAALQLLREQDPDVGLASDLQLARAILAR
ncbi:DUF2388 domain-containing protein [Luteimonas sp. BDR2-5]|nr:DUF2388 domain-containing protein [Luteimonas sp. BDR2-5]MCD9027696.1 DUF2388 domain-containing protein [Luteimonas sp. BDR2-5]